MGNDVSVNSETSVMRQFQDSSAHSLEDAYRDNGTCMYVHQDEYMYYSLRPKKGDSKRLNFILKLKDSTLY